MFRAVATLLLNVSVDVPELSIKFVPPMFHTVLVPPSVQLPDFISSVRETLPLDTKLPTVTFLSLASSVPPIIDSYDAESRLSLSVNVPPTPSTVSGD